MRGSGPLYGYWIGESREGTAKADIAGPMHGMRFQRGAEPPHILWGRLQRSRTRLPENAGPVVAAQYSALFAVGVGGEWFEGDS